MEALLVANGSGFLCQGGQHRPLVGSMGIQIQVCVCSLLDTGSHLGLLYILVSRKGGGGVVIFISHRGDGCCYECC
jgi:hypothetical protein